MSDASDLLDSFKKELPNLGTWYWTGDEGSQARLLVVITKLMKASVPKDLIADTITSVMFIGYVEHERQVKAKTGMTVREFIEKKMEVLPADATKLPPTTGPDLGLPPVPPQ